MKHLGTSSTTLCVRMLKYLKKCWKENKRKARECDRKMLTKQGVSEEQATKLNELMFRGRIWE